MTPAFFVLRYSLTMFVLSSSYLDRYDFMVLAVRPAFEMLPALKPWITNVPRRMRFGSWNWYRRDNHFRQGSPGNHGGDIPGQGSSRPGGYSGRIGDRLVDTRPKNMYLLLYPSFQRKCRDPPRRTCSRSHRFPHGYSSWNLCGNRQVHRT